MASPTFQLWQSVRLRKQLWQQLLKLKLRQQLACQSPVDGKLAQLGTTATTTTTLSSTGSSKQSRPG
jgi:hypothetical protein